ncbi:MAG: hypothetical protein V1887_00100 [Candidatus Aenigmatarchaeota archaeon]
MRYARLESGHDANPAGLARIGRGRIVEIVYCMGDPECLVKLEVNDTDPKQGDEEMKLLSDMLRKAGYTLHPLPVIGDAKGYSQSST